MQGLGLSIQDVFFPTDLDDHQELAFAHAVKIAVAANAKLRVFHASERDTPRPEWSDYPSAHEMLERWRSAPAGEGNLPDMHLHAAKVSGHGHDVLRTTLRHLERHPTQLLVLATGGRMGLQRLTEPSTAESLARENKTLTLFLPEDARGFVDLERGHSRLRQIIVPIDTAPEPGPGLTCAARFAQSLGEGFGTILQLHAGTHPPATSAHPVEGWSWEDRVDAREAAVDSILGAAEERSADLIVMVTAGRHGLLDALRGSTTEQVVRRAPCPVLAVPSTNP